MSVDSLCYMSPKLEVRPVPDKGGLGMFARQAIEAGELLLVMGGRILDHAGLASLSHTFSIQVEDDIYISPVVDEQAYRINHSCNPNAGVVGQITFVALRAIAPDEEVCYDYAMTDGGPYDEFDCRCGQPNCRGRVTGSDWQLPDLWARYGDHFSAYLLRRIRPLRAALERSANHA